MRFEQRDTDLCAGWQLAHSLTVNGVHYPKAARLDNTHIKKISSAKIPKLYVFQLSSEDISENDAADKIANIICGSNVTAHKAKHGRVDIFASCDGRFGADQAINELNQLNSSITIATLEANKLVKAGDRLATVKIIPYGVPAIEIQKYTATSELLNVLPYEPKNACFISTDQKLTEKAFVTIQDRCADRAVSITQRLSCDHTVEDIQNQLKLIDYTQIDIVLILGKAATSDKRDVIPQAIEAAGGDIDRVGMPAEPGNLLVYATLHTPHFKCIVPIIGLPGCIKSPLFNGFDRVLADISTGKAVSFSNIANIGIGGLTARAPKQATALSQDKTQIKAIILAAGKANRAGGIKLLANISGKTILAHTIDTYRNYNPTIVTGHRSDDIAKIVEEANVPHVHNPDYAQGLSTSLKIGISTVLPNCDYLLIALADMPFVQQKTITTMSEAVKDHPDAGIIIPTCGGKRGNPILWHRRYFDALNTVTGDKGGRFVIHKNECDVLEVETHDPGILLDLDTPEMLAQFGAVVAP